MLLFSFHTAANDIGRISEHIFGIGRKVFLVIDEAHYLKNQDGWLANEIARISEFPVKKCMLTGTPMPNKPMDAYYYFDFLWGTDQIINNIDKGRILQSSNMEIARKG